MPSLDSYVRVQDFSNTVGTYVAWGTQNREVPVRKIDHDSGHWELRFFDASANMYLAIAMALAAGLEGIIQAIDLNVKDCQVWPGRIGRKGMEDLGAGELLPKSLAEAVRILKEDDGGLAGEMLGKKMKHVYVTMKEEDIEALIKMTDEERRRLYVRSY